MAKKKILCVGFELASDEVTFCNFESKLSLLDWDIILFQPNVDHYFDYQSYYEGKHLLSNQKSFKIKENIEHWRREIQTALEHGKTIIIYLAKLEEFYIDSGQREHSGTGKNRKFTTMVQIYSNYKITPLELNLTETIGKEIKFSSQNSEVIREYWSEFCKLSSYNVTIESDEIIKFLVTKSGNKMVGGLFKSQNLPGSLVFLPDINFEASEFYNKGDYSDLAIQFSARMIKSIINLHGSLIKLSDTTPTPEWVEDEKYLIEKERHITVKLLEVEDKIINEQKKKDKLIVELNQAGLVKGLLYEKGKTLEALIILALETMGFRASQFQHGDSEFDVVFESVEGRFIGEVEGKDSQAINIDKLRQLNMNVLEDLDRAEVDVQAKGVLFGNACRLNPLSERSEPFTTKCTDSAKSHSVALVYTPDLFFVVQYLLNNEDSKYAEQCRKVIVHTNGRVTFPVLPYITEEQVDFQEKSN